MIFTHKPININIYFNLYPTNWGPFEPHAYKLFGYFLGFEIFDSEFYEFVHSVICARYGFETNYLQVFIQLEILTVYDMYRVHLAIFMFKCVNNMMPLKKSYTFPANSSVHSHFTRRCGDLRIDHCRTLCRWTTVQIEGPKLWNMLPMSVKNLPTLPQFKYKVKQYFMHLIG